MKPHALQQYATTFGAMVAAALRPINTTEAPLSSIMPQHFGQDFGLDIIPEPSSIKLRESGR